MRLGLRGAKSNAVVDRRFRLRSGPRRDPTLAAHAPILPAESNNARGGYNLSGILNDSSPPGSFIKAKSLSR